MFNQAHGGPILLHLLVSMFYALPQDEITKAKKALKSQKYPFL